MEHMSWEFNRLCAVIFVCECALVNCIVRSVLYHSPDMWQGFKLSMCSLN